MLLKGNCLDLLKTLPDNSVDSIVTDPPYELGFMGKSWDSSGIAYSTDLWQECLRVLKPGGHLLAFGGSRTYHRLACAVEDAGFEIRDQIMWLYGSGFPKSLDVSKAIDKRGGASAGFEAFRDAVKEAMKRNGVSRAQLQEALGNFMLSHYLTAGSQPAVPNYTDYQIIRDTVRLGDRFDDLFRIEAEREVVGSKTSGIANKDERPRHTIGASKSVEVDITAPATPEAQRWQGWGTALKPSHEPIVVARKPLIGTVAQNVLTYGTGALNIDGSRVGYDEGEVDFDKVQRQQNSDGAIDGAFGAASLIGKEIPTYKPGGRWPANLILTHSPDCEQVGVAEDTLQAGERTANFGTQETQSGGNGSGNWGSKSVTVPVWECAEGCPVKGLDRQSGVRKSPKPYTPNPDTAKNGMFGGLGGVNHGTEFGDSGGASRFFTQTEYTEADWPEFFYCAKASKSERNAGLEGFTSTHPTVKPLALMRYLIKLVTPPNGTVLDPFLGSGTTAVAAVLEGFDWIGCEMTEDYWPIIEARVEWAEAQPKTLL